MQARQVFSTYNWKEESRPEKFTYCPFCRTKLRSEARGGEQRPTCPACGLVQFSNPAPGVVVLIEKEGRVLLGKRAGNFGRGKWCLPQGYIEFDDDFLSAAKREVKEETGLSVEIRAIISVVSNFLSPKVHTLAIVLLAHMVDGEPCAGDDLDAVNWFPLAGPLPEMAFEADAHIIERYWKTKLEGAPVDPNYSCP